MFAFATISNTTRELLKSVSPRFRDLIIQIAEGKNPNIPFPFMEGTLPHPPHTDRRELRNALTVQFNGVAGGAVVAHLFTDGTIKTSTQMHTENQRRAKEERLAAEESKFPELQQTVARKQAESRMMIRIQAASMNISWSIMQKQLKAPQQEYRVFLQEQAKEREQAAQIGH
ncbi:hypothetical protein BJY01DRAFT_246197 [Aspergillus pseudoustus]|uniref:Uncharacterized protein n=1 Tax=Aspergillus pseudoustus TaxID=1810923 RepID=A0ABR4K964_9EURO